MKITDRARLAIQAFNAPATKNSASLREARAFLKYGNGKVQSPDWSQVVMDDHDVYSGAMYGAIKKRGVSVAMLATYNLKTKGTKAEEDKAKKSDEGLVHPYMDIINSPQSPQSTFMFWNLTSRRLDLKGVSYILVVRNVTETMIGQPQYFKLLNPYNVQRIFDERTGELLGYKEYRNGMVRDLPKEMVIPVIDVDPINDEPHAMTQAAKDNQFTLKTANDYTRSAIRNNINAPGIIATDQVLEGEELANFKSRIMGHQKGEPIFGGGAGSITWNDMQSDLTKTALKDVNAINLNGLIAASGVSKTMLAIEESGTTRDTAKLQKDNFIESEAMTTLQLIIDALNQDYKQTYPNEYARTNYEMYIDNPLGSDRDAELKDVDIRTKKQDLYELLLGKGYPSDVAAKYVDGKINIDELGTPANQSQPQDTPADQPVDNPVNTVDIDLTPQQKHLQQLQQGIQQSAQASLQNTIINIDNRLLASVAKRVGAAKNAFTSQDELLTTKQQNDYQNELELALAAFYGIMLPLYANGTLSSRMEQYGKQITFNLNQDVNNFVKQVASKTSASHVNTLLEAMIKQAQADAAAGLTMSDISKNLINKFGGEITNTRAVAVARTESNRVFTMAQYEADKQFIRQGGFFGKAYKQWVTTSGNPCSFCQAMAQRPPIPFDEPFAEVGDELSATAEVDGKTVVKKMTMSFLDADAGNLHVNCGCRYELIIKD